MKSRHREALTALAFLLPNLVGFLAFSLIPMVASLLLGFFHWSPLHGAGGTIESMEFSGLTNFWRALGWHTRADGTVFLNDPFFWKYLGNTLFLMLGIPVSIMGSLLLASLLSKRIKGAAFFITIFFLPSITSGVATFTIWLGLLHPETGLINGLLSLLNINGPEWLSDIHWAKPSLIMMGLWGGIGGYNMVLYIAALQSIPRELYEAAEIDGAGPVGQFWNITWPMVSPTTFFIFTMSIIHGFQGGFAAAYIMTQGGPAGSTTTISYYIYNLAFSRLFEMGYASAVAWILFIITFLLSLLNWRYGRKRVHGEMSV
jgi:multiple sugar transport system permease protein